MKKIIICLIVCFLVIFAIVFNWYTSNIKNVREVKSFNNEFEQYFNDEGITGVTLTSIINKAIDNNEKYKISKDNNKTYINDNEYSIEITIKVSEER
jgi:hypothetical protein